MNSLYLYFYIPRQAICGVSGILELGNVWAFIQLANEDQKSAAQKPKHSLTPGFLIPLDIKENTCKEIFRLTVVGHAVVIIVGILVIGNAIVIRVFVFLVLIHNAIVIVIGIVWKKRVQWLGGSEHRTEPSCMHRWEHNTLANYNTNGNSRSVRHVRACGAKNCPRSTTPQCSFKCRLE